MTAAPLFPEPLFRELLCAGKQSWRSRAAAWRVLAERNARRGKKSRCVLSVYRCARCGEWHLGGTGR